MHKSSLKKVKENVKKKKFNQSHHSFINRIKEGASDYFPTEDCIAKGLGWTGDLKPIECTTQECVVRLKSLFQGPDCVKMLKGFFDEEVKEEFRNKESEAFVKL